MNRTDRLYALTEALRAASPHPRSGRWLARHFEVSVRTIERDVGLLQGEGVPVAARSGPAGGYALDRTWSWPPGFTPEEVLALAVSLRSVLGTAFAEPAHAGLLRILATLPRSEVATLRLLTDRVRLPEGRSVLSLEYHDGAGTLSVRDVEPLGLFGNAEHWYLIAWCRLRGGIRGFRLDRITALTPTGEPAPEREVALGERVVPGRDLASLHRPLVEAA
jgi:predicted DNA-binding transcriptional regulator YafY